MLDSRAVLDIAHPIQRSVGDLGGTEQDGSRYRENAPPGRHGFAESADDVGDADEVAGPTSLPDRTLSSMAMRPSSMRAHKLR